MSNVRYVVRIPSVESQQYLQKDVLEALYGLYCFNHIFQNCFNRSVVWPLISNHFVKGVLILCQTVLIDALIFDL